MFFFLAPEPSPKRVSTSGPTVAETALPWKRYTDGKFGLIIEKRLFIDIGLFLKTYSFIDLILVVFRSSEDFFLYFLIWWIVECHISWIKNYRG